MLRIVTRESKASKHCSKSLCWKHGFDSHGVTLQSSLDRDLLASELREFRLVAFQDVDLFLHGQSALRAVFHTHLGTFGRGLVLGHVRSAAHRIGEDSRKRLLLRNCRKRARK